MHTTTDTAGAGNLTVISGVTDNRSNRTLVFNNNQVSNHTRDGVLQIVTHDPEEDNLEGLISAATALVIQTVVEVGILPVLVLCGVTMNVINMAVFYRQGLSDRINLCLFRFVCIFRVVEVGVGRWWLWFKQSLFTFMKISKLQITV